MSKLDRMKKTAKRKRYYGGDSYLGLPPVSVEQRHLSPEEKKRKALYEALSMEPGPFDYEDMRHREMEQTILEARKGSSYAVDGTLARVGKTWVETPRLLRRDAERYREMNRDAERELKFRSRENPSVVSVALPVLGLASAGFGIWRKMQRDKFATMLRANAPFSLASEAHRQELVDERVPWFGTTSADKAWEDLVGHPENWTEWASRSLPGVQSIRDALHRLPSGANRAQDTGWVKSVRNWFGDVSFGSY